MKHFTHLSLLCTLLFSAFACEPAETPSTPDPTIEVTGLVENNIIEAEPADPLTFTVKADADWEIKKTNLSFATFTPQNGKAGEKVTVTVSCTNNTTSAEGRNGSFEIIAGATRKSYTITQMGAKPFVSITGTDIVNDNVSVDCNEKTISVTVNANVAWTLSATSDGGWITLSATSGDGTAPANVTVTITANTDSQPRSGSFTVTDGDKATHTITVDQEGFVDIPTLSISDVAGTGATITDNDKAYTIDFIQAGGSVTFKVNSNHDWAFSSEDSESWYTVSPSTGKADETTTVTLTAPAHDVIGAIRTGTFTISTEPTQAGATETVTFTLSQKGKPDPDVEETIAKFPVTWTFNSDNAAAHGITFVKPEPYCVADNYEGAKLLFNMDNSIISDEDTGRSLKIYGGNQTTMPGNQIYVSNIRKGDSWQFDVPVKKLTAGTKVKFECHMAALGSGSSAAPRAWSLYVKEEDNYRCTSEQKTKDVECTDVTDNKETISYVYELQNKSFLEISETVTLQKPIENGVLSFRLKCESHWWKAKNSSQMTSTMGNGGSASVVSHSSLETVAPITISIVE